jgi:hypothetical protein
MKRTLIIIIFIFSSSLINAADSTRKPVIKVEGAEKTVSCSLSFDKVDRGHSVESFALSMVSPAAGGAGASKSKPIIINLPESYRRDLKDTTECFENWCLAKGIDEDEVDRKVRADFKIQWQSNKFSFESDEQCMLAGKLKKSWVVFIGKSMEGVFVIDLRAQLSTVNATRKIRGEASLASEADLVAYHLGDSGPGSLLITGKGSMALAYLVAQHHRYPEMLARFEAAHHITPRLMERLSTQAKALHDERLAKSISLK